MDYPETRAAAAAMKKHMEAIKFLGKRHWVLFDVDGFIEAIDYCPLDNPACICTNIYYAFGTWHVELNREKGIDLGFPLHDFRLAALIAETYLDGEAKHA